MKQRPFSDVRQSMRTNVLLQRPKVGAVIQATRSLREEGFAYTPMYHDDHGVKEIFQDWEKVERTQTANRERIARKRAVRRQDFVATNRSALRGGCVTAKEFREFKKGHAILVRAEENFDAADDEYNKVVRRALVHGITTPVSTEMRETLTWQAGRDAVERARSRQATRHLPSVEIVKRRSWQGVKLTKGARGETVKGSPPRTHGDDYKIPRFRDIGRYAIDDTCPASTSP
jgi:hypothetical protein